MALITSICAPFRTALAQAMKSRTFRAGDMIMRQGDPGDALYIIESGSAAVLIDGVGEVAVKKRG